MKKNFIKYICSLAVAPMLLSSCSDDFLNEIDPNRQTPTTFWTSEDNVMKGLSAVYNPFRSSRNIGRIFRRILLRIYSSCRLVLSVT